MPVRPRGEPGELLSRGYIVMLGYWEDAAATAQAVDSARGEKLHVRRECFLVERLASVRQRCHSSG